MPLKPVEKTHQIDFFTHLALGLRSQRLPNGKNYCLSLSHQTAHGLNAFLTSLPRRLRFRALEGDIGVLGDTGVLNPCLCVYETPQWIVWAAYISLLQGEEDDCSCGHADRIQLHFA